MIPTIYLSVLSIFVLYIFFVLTKKFWVKVFFNIDVCSFCMAVASTWLWMIILRGLNIIEIDNIVLAILLGHTVIGMLWKFENYYKSKGYKKWYIIRLIYIVSAQLVVYYVVTLNPDFQLALIAGIIGLVLTTYLFFNFSKMGLKNFWNDITRKDKKEKGSDEDKEHSTNKPDSKNKENAKTEDEKALEKMDKMFEECC